VVQLPTGNDSVTVNAIVPDAVVLEVNVPCVVKAMRTGGAPAVEIVNVLPEMACGWLNVMLTPPLVPQAVALYVSEKCVKALFAMVNPMVFPSDVVPAQVPS
jgi:hypothetical protein